MSHPPRTQSPPTPTVPMEMDHPEVFRDPTRRERRLAAGLFIGFGIGVTMLFVVLEGWWFRWVMLGLGGYSLLEGVKHLRHGFGGSRRS